MHNTWILVAHRAGARLMENPGPGKGLQRLQEIAHPEGRLKNQEINADKPGGAFANHDPGRHDLSKEHVPMEQLTRQFAKQLASLLEKGRVENRYEKLLLVAEPGFLGELRAALDSHTRARVFASVNKDLAGVEDRDLGGHLKDVIRL